MEKSIRRGSSWPTPRASSRLGASAAVPVLERPAAAFVGPAAKIPPLTTSRNTAFHRAAKPVYGELVASACDCRLAAAEDNRQAHTSTTAMLSSRPSIRPISVRSSQATLRLLVDTAPHRQAAAAGERRHETRFHRPLSTSHPVLKTLSRRRPIFRERVGKFGPSTSPKRSSYRCSTIDDKLR